MFCALSVLLCSVQHCAALYWAALYCAVLLWCSASAVVCSLYKFSSAKNSSQLALFCARCCAVLSVAAVSVGLGLFNVLRTAFAFSGISNTQNECQPGRQAYVHRGRRQAEPVSSSSSSSANAGTDNVSVFVYLLHWCVYLCFVHSVRSLGTFRWLVRSMCAKQRQQHSTTHTHHQNSHTYTYHVRVYLAWPRFHCMRS